MEEISIIKSYINFILLPVGDLNKRLPLDTENAKKDLKSKLKDGVILNHLLNRFETDRVDIRTINSGPNLNICEMRQNLDQFFTSCHGLIHLNNEIKA